MSDEVRIDVQAEDSASPVLDKTKASIDGVGAAAGKAEPKITGLDTRLQRLSSGTDKSNKSTEEQRKRLDAAGESADNAETRFTGLASGIDGVTTLMDNPSPQEFAQGIADMADGAANSLVPALKAVRDNASNMLQKLTGASSGLGALGRAAVGAAGIAGIGLLVNAIQDAEQKRKELQVDKLTQEFMALGNAVTAADISAVGLLRGDLDKVFDNLLAQSPRLAEEMITWGESVGLTSEKTDEWREKLDRTADAQEGLAAATEAAKTNIELAAEETAAFNDELDRLLGKSFSVAEAEANLTLAIAQATETVKANKDEHGAAALSLDRHTAAGAENHLMIQGLVEQEADYIRALQESGLSNEDLAGKINQSVLTLEGQLLKMGFTKDQVKIYTAALRAVPGTVRTNIGTRGVQQSIHDIDRIRRELDALDGKSAHIRIVGTQVGAVLPGGARVNAHGGLIGAATGGIHSSMRLVGEHGPELVSLPTGSMVHSNPDTERMLATGGGPATVNLVIESGGSSLDNFLADALRRYVKVAAGGDVQVALGYRR